MYCGGSITGDILPQEISDFFEILRFGLRDVEGKRGGKRLEGNTQETEGNTNQRAVIFEHLFKNIIKFYM